MRERILVGVGSAALAACRETANLSKDRSDEDVPKKPLVINGMGGGVMREGKPEGLGHGGALLAGVVESGVQVGQQLVPHLEGTPPCICH